MSKIEINIADYLSEDDLKQIVITIVKEEVRKKFLNDTKQLERIISNNSYDILFNVIDETFDMDVKTLVKNKTIDIINNYNTDFGIFRVKNAWDREESIGTIFVKQIVTDNFKLLENSVVTAMKQIPKSIINTQLKEVLIDKMNSIFK